MKKDVAKKWIKALRSGEYLQASGFLQVDNRYCCLGVLCKLGEKEQISPAYRADKTLSGGNLNAQAQIHDWSGMHSYTGSLLQLKDLTELNDAGTTFAAIADIIEANWEEL